MKPTTFRAAAIAAAFIAVSLRAGAWPNAAQQATTKADLQSITQLRIVYVDDGDTVVGLDAANDQKKIRLASIDAPESSHTNKERGRIGQPFSDNSKRFLESMVKGKTVGTHCVDSDRYGRLVCELLVDGKSVNAEMVRSGWAWANTAADGRYLRDKSLPAAQAQAQKARTGLWAGANPVPPWDWRKLCWEQGNCPN